MRLLAHVGRTAAVYDACVRANYERNEALDRAGDGRRGDLGDFG